MVKKLIFLGAPGVGKGTLSKILCEKYNLKHISTGDLFRMEIESDTPLGREVKKILEAGEYVPDDLTNEIVMHTLRDEELQNQGFILDGYPRTLTQAEFLKEQNFGIQNAVELQASLSEVQGRLIQRGRTDDTPEIIEARFAIYNEKTLPLLHFYKHDRRLVQIDATGTIEQNLREVEQALFND